ncbi:hypothetical protein PQU96_03400 [Vogesella sp. LYT5W]|uniref:Matrixin n=1 Tax=Vogesella margarita TaxID=2984199 RepID=A0ABT5IKU6_9NEIS|nr:hypothetical protein [Vogesella margarita]MDC7713185.1 hypothetical protein [Vogesella margarita]
MSRTTLLAGTLLASLLAAPLAQANHAWGNYHWARTGNPFTVQLGNNVDTDWQPHLDGASSDWSKSTVLATKIVTGGTTAKRCRPTSGRVEVCNALYGNNGWLGLAQIWASGSHIVQGTTKLNDSYFRTASYNTPAWRQLVMCQEIGHNFGLGHQDENFSNPNLGTCMDYTNDPSTNLSPNAHDYDELAIIYSHLDASTTLAAMPAAMANLELATPGQWGRLLRSQRGGMVETYVQDFGHGWRVYTHVIWAEERGHRPHD